LVVPPVLHLIVLLLVVLFLFLFLFLGVTAMPPITVQHGLPEAGTLAQRPGGPNLPGMFFATDQGTLYCWNGTHWWWATGVEYGSSSSSSSSSSSA